MARGAHHLATPALFLIAFLARLAAIGRYVTPDELNWVYRSLGLRRALLTADWANTIQSGHPGITTTWIGALGAQIRLWLQPDLVARLDWLDRLQQLSTDNVEAYRHLYAFLNGGRLGMALIVSLGLVLVYLLARDLLGSPAAFLGAVLLALDPFFAGLSGLLHVDGLLALFILLALLLALHAQRDAPRAAAGAGVFSALAILTKTPGLVLLALAPLILLWPVTGDRRAGENEADAAPVSTPQAGRRVRQLLIWAVALAVTVIVLLPALWAAPRHVVEIVSGLTGRLVVDAVRPTFFLGRTALEHGPLYYPLVLLFRLSPAAVVGLAFSIVALARRRSGGESARWLLLFVLLFLLAITLAAKKFDRYALPSLVPLTFLGGWGLAQANGLMPRDRRRLWATAIVLQAAFLLSAWPHPLTANNWLVGGNTVARRVFPSGWGEDAGRAARTLASLLDRPRQATLFTSSLTGTAPFFPGDIIRLRQTNLTRLQPQHVLLILPQDAQLQPLLLPPQTAETRLETVQVKGVGTATLYRGLDAASLGQPIFSFEPRQARFGPALSLTGAGSAFLPWPGETLVGLTWQRQAAPDLSPAYRLQLALIDERGQVWVQREMPLLNQDDHAPPDWSPGVPQTVFYGVRLPATLAPGDYRWVARLFDDRGRQQAVFDSSGAFAGVQRPVARITVTPPPSQPALDIAHPVAGEGPLVGYDPLPQTATAGAPFTLDLWWRAQDVSLLALVLHAGDVQSATTLQTGRWRDDQVYQIRPTWRLPLATAPGPQPLSLSVRDERDGSLLAGPIALGDVQVEHRPQRDVLPQAVEARQIQLGDLALLQDLSLEVLEQHVLVHVIWQARETTFTDYTAFVHLRDGDRVLAADDRQPSPPTSYWAPGEVVEETYTLPRPDPGAYTVALGLYDAAGGERLPMRDAGGQALAGNQILLPLEVP